MKRLEPEADHSPTSIAKEYGSAKLELFSPSACSLEKSGFGFHIKAEVLFYLPYRNLTNFLAIDTTFLNFNSNLFHTARDFFYRFFKIFLQSIGCLLFQQIFCLKCLLQLHCPL